MIARDVYRVRPVHELAVRAEVQPAGEPRVEGLGFGHEGGHRRPIVAGYAREGAEERGEIERVRRQEIHEVSEQLGRDAVGRARTRRSGGKAELRCQPGAPGVGVEIGEAAERGLRELDAALGGVGEQRQQRLGEADEVPVRDLRLVAVGVAALRIDRAEHGRRVEVVHERARAVVDGLAGDGHIVGVHHAVDKADVHPLRDERGLRGDHRVEEREVRVLRVGGVGVVARDGVVGEAAQEVVVAGDARVLERADAQVAGGDAHEHRAGLDGFAAHAVARGDDGERAGGRHAERGHRLADQVLAQHRPEDRAAIAHPREPGASGALEPDVAQPPRAVAELAEQERAPVAEVRVEVAELVPRIGLGDEGPGGGVLPGEERRSVVAAQPVGVEAELGGERIVDRDQLRLRRHLGGGRDRHLGQRLGELRVEMDGG